MSFVFVLCVCVCHVMLQFQAACLIHSYDSYAEGKMGNGEGGGGSFRGRKIGIYFIKIFRLKNMRQQQGQ